MENASLIGYSAKINDPAFARYMKNANRWAAIFAGGLAIVAVVGFYIAGETSSEMKNPDSLYIGLGIGGMFLLIAFFQIMGKRRSHTWDGMVIDKTAIKKHKRNRTGDDDYIRVDYMEYTVHIRDDKGRKHRIRTENDHTRYDYFQIGDKVRHHKGLNTYEKYDKSHDSVIFCNACSSLNDIQGEYCSRCHCPLLK